MKNCFFLLAFSALGLSIFAQNGNDRAPDARTDYIKKYQHLAIEEMESSGVPASIKLGQAILESNAGQSTLAVEANNHFGLKCHNGWNGKSFYQEDDDRDANGNKIKSCFRKYRSVEACYEDHSDFLRDPKKHYRYGFLFKLNPQDYRSWAYGLQSAGYATAETYAESLIRVIETYRLYEFDKRGGGDVPPPIANRRTIGRVNDVKVVSAKEGESLEDIARIYRLNAAKLIEYNDRGYARSDKLRGNTRIFIQKKAKRWHGRSKFHFVRDKQTMFEISQLYGVQLERLLTGNKMDAGEEPANGEKVRLRGFFWKKGPKPRLRAADDEKKTDENGKPVVPGTDPKPQTPPTVEDGKMTPDEDELFEIGHGEVKTDKDKQPSGGLKPPPTRTDKPSTTGTPVPTTPPTPNTGTGTGNNTGGVVMPPPVTRPTVPQGTGAGVYHTVVKGDTLYNISKRYGMTVDRLKQLNNMKDDYIQIGQSLRVQ